MTTDQEVRGSSPFGRASYVWFSLTTSAIAAGRGAYRRRETSDDRPYPTYTAVVERDADTDLHIGYVPGWPGAHSQGATPEGLLANLGKVIAMLLEDGEPNLEAEFFGTQAIQIA